jgi:hypothetical protein
MFKKIALGRTGGMDTAFQTSTHFLTLRSAVTLSRTIPEVFDEWVWRPLRKLPEALSRRTSRRRESCRRLLRPRLFPNSSRVGMGVVMLTERPIVFLFYSMLWIGSKDIVPAKVGAMDRTREVVTQRWKLRVWHGLQMPNFSTTVTKTVTVTKK